MPISVLAIDPSITGCGVSCGDKETVEIATVPNDDQSPAQNLQRRCQEIIAKIIAFVNRNYSPDDELVVVIESPSYGSHGGLVEAGWMLCELYNRLPSMLQPRRLSIIEVAPTTLKKAIGGHGRADKDQMKAAIKERWGKEFELDKKGNKTDAYALYKFGIGVLEGTIELKRTPRRGKGKGQKKSDTTKSKTDRQEATRTQSSGAIGSDNSGGRKRGKSKTVSVERKRNVKVAVQRG